jgi:hypothetical protein
MRRACASKLDGTNTSAGPVGYGPSPTPLKLTGIPPPRVGPSRSHPRPTTASKRLTRSLLPYLDHFMFVSLGARVASPAGAPTSGRARARGSRVLMVVAVSSLVDRARPLADSSWSLHIQHPDSSRHRRPHRVGGVGAGAAAPSASADPPPSKRSQGSTAQADERAGAV